jgi:hypothetical protein
MIRPHYSLHCCDDEAASAQVAPKYNMTLSKLFTPGPSVATLQQKLFLRLKPPSDAVLLFNRDSSPHGDLKCLISNKQFRYGEYRNQVTVRNAAGTNALRFSAPRLST